MRKEGEILKELIQNNRVNVSRLANKLGMSRQNIYHLFTVEKLDSDTVKKLSNEGLDIRNVSVLNEPEQPYKTKAIQEINEQTKRFLDIYRPIIYKAGYKSEAEFCDKILDWNNSLLTQAKKGDRNIPDYVLYRFIEHFKIDDKLIFGGVSTNSPKVSSKAIPVYDVDFSAGDIGFFTESNQQPIGYIDFEGFRKCIAFVKVKGSSMYPDFIAGDYIGLEPITNFEIIEYGQPYGIETVNEQRMIKIIRRGKDDENLILRSTNTNYDDIHIHKSKITKLYKVHGPIRDTWQ